MTDTKEGKRTPCPVCRSAGGPGGRKPKVSDELTKAIAAGIAGGMLARDAATQGGISEDTFHDWISRGRATTCRGCGRKVNPGYVRFAEAIEKAKGLRRSLLLNRIDKAAREPKHWTAAAWILERTESATFAPKVQHVIRAELEGALDRIAEEFRQEPETFERILRCLAGESLSGPSTRGTGDAADRSGRAGDPAGSAPTVAE
jgi:hypothetical protein